MPLKNLMAAAIDKANEGITIADARLPDTPLVYVNKGFVRMTGYSEAEVLYPNCRFLQGEEQDQPGLKELRDAMENKQSVSTVLINYKKDGTRFYNRLSVTPLFDESGRVTHYFGLQEDITQLREKEVAAQRLAQDTLLQNLTEQIRQDERELLGEELHDNINQLLATSNLLLNVESQSFEEQRELMHNSSMLIKTAIEEIRKLSHRLVQPHFEFNSLQDALQHLVHNLQPALPFNIDLDISMNETRLTTARCLLLYRVVQEGVNNSIKYANPSSLAIKLREQKQGIQLSIQDNGVGFEPHLDGEGIGLRNLRSRIQKERGVFEISSAPGNGCKLVVTLPFAGSRKQSPKEQSRNTA